MATSGKKKSVSRASKAAASRRAAGSTSTKKKAAKKKTAVRKVTKKKAVVKKKAVKKAATKKKVVKKAAKAAPKKKAAKKAPATKKKAVKKKAAKKKVVKKVAKKKAARSTKKVAAAKPTANRKTSVKRPRVPYASLDEARPAAYNPYDHTPPTPAQLRKVKTGLTAKDKRYFRLLLLERRAEIIGDVQGLEAARSGNAGEISHMPLHMADVGSDNYEQEFMLGLMESERKIIIEIDEALQRLEDKTYGVCIDSGVPIGRPRLEAKPWAKYCIEVARERERRGVR